MGTGSARGSELEVGVLRLPSPQATVEVEAHAPDYLTAAVQVARHPFVSVFVIGGPIFR